MRSVALTLALCALAAPLSGCLFQHGDGGGSSGGATAEQDVAQYDQLQHELEATRSPFLSPGAAALTSAGTRLFWLDFATAAPHVHSFDSSTNASVDYGFSIGGVDVYNMRPSEDLVVTVDTSTSQLVYKAYDVTQPEKLLGSFSLPAPAIDVKWWAYAPDHGTVYVVVTGAKTELERWQVGDEAPTNLFAFEDVGIQVGDFEDFGVQGNTLVLIESGRMWSVDLAARHATFLQNKEEADAAWLGGDGVLYEAANGPFFFDFSNDSLIDVGKSIEDSGFRLNTTFADAHLYDVAGSSHDGTSLARWNRHVGYMAESGLFTIDLDTNAVKPLLLDALDDSIVYTSPVFLDDGTVFVKGLQSNEGDIGVDGPVYRLNVDL
ncbi:MAG TPA: hypothetical protein VGM56_15505 [Byssovorax sp.]|jgi:hypothetical protein